MCANVRTIILMCVSLCLMTGHLRAQQIEDVIRVISGEDDVENYDPEVLEAVYEMKNNPVRINASGISTLESCGLFTPYQLASLDDYRKRHGSILSLNELSCVDGFDPEFVKVISPFITIDTGSFKTPRSGFSADIGLRGGYKYDPAKQFGKSTYGLRSRIRFADEFSLSISATEPYDTSKAWPTVYTGNLTWQHKMGKVVFGDFNARFGQGLCMWNTATFSSLTSPAAFMKRPSGLAPSYSYTGSSALTGLAADYTLGKWKATAIVALPGIRKNGFKDGTVALAPSVNLTRYGSAGHVSMTHHMSFSNIFSSMYRIPQMKSAVDCSFCIRGVNIFSEAAVDWVSVTPAVVAGVETGIGERLVMASLVRYNPASNEHASALSCEMNYKSHRLSVSAEGKYHPVTKSKDGHESYHMKVQTDWEWMVLPGLQVRMKLSERVRTWGNFFKTDLRTDVRYESDCWNATLRFDCLYGIDFAACGYAEGGYTGSWLSVYARYGMFAVDNWDDRIYVCERDSPGYFNVPALYGRGFWTSIYLVWKYAVWGTVYLRGIYKNPGNAEVKLQCLLHF